jgi:acetate kinase
VRSAAAGIAAMASCLPRLDALIFTGGIGERSAEIRRRIAERLTVLSIEAPAVADVDTDSVVSAFGARVAVLRIEAREDIVVARQTAAVIASGSAVDES